MGNDQDVPTDAFKDGTFSQNAKTVGELIEKLQQLDPTTPIKQGFSDSVDAVIFNVRDSQRRHVSFEDGLSWSDRQPKD